ncbi:MULTISPECIES: hypothetical protein [Priestia]|uniref:hypothetical protein n=1 Tax=Priestia TaxID=2800373 RepID=UPI00233074E1|nr:hypothetical protein [Priestia sp. AB]MDC0705494.1 hypothetical protein [Priestia sp. AB]MED4212098.1 hypothetical protein [Priestia megaterium]
MNVNDKWYLAKYEPASNVGSYNWDYKFDNNYKGANLVNRYLIKEDKLSLFLNSENYYFYVVKPIEGHSKIQKLFRERNLQKKGFQDLHYSYIRDEKSNTPYYVSADIRTIKYCYKSLNKDDNPFTLDLFNGDNDTVILFSKEEIRENLIVDYLKNEELQPWRNKETNALLNFLNEKEVGLVYKHDYFFHEEATARPELEETVFICYVPWILT